MKKTCAGLAYRTETAVFCSSGRVLSYERLCAAHGATSGNRTRTTCLEGRGSAVELWRRVSDLHVLTINGFRGVEIFEGPFFVFDPTPSRGPTPAPRGAPLYAVEGGGCVPPCVAGTPLYTSRWGFFAYAKLWGIGNQFCTLPCNPLGTKGLRFRLALLLQLVATGAGNQGSSSSAESEGSALRAATARSCSSVSLVRSKLARGLSSRLPISSPSRGRSPAVSRR